VLVATLLLPLLVTSHAKITNTNALVAAMQKQYGKSWYKTATFVQQTTNFQPDGTSKVETWCEAMSVPGSLRIDFTPTSAGNGILFTDGKIFVFKDGKVDATRPFEHPLLILGFDIYRSPASDVTAKLQALKFDLSQLERIAGREEQSMLLAQKPATCTPRSSGSTRRIFTLSECFVPGERMARKRRRPNSTSTRNLAAAGWRLK
jgi:hypothetical protein